VIQADGGTRTASITGGCVALIDAVRYLQREKLIKTDPFEQLVSSVSVGLYRGQPVVDLDYPEDSSADTDMNVVLSEAGELIEVQGTAESGTFSRAQLNAMLDLAEKAGHELFEHQREALGNRS
ncbi:MAG: ribonuclease PH, partial [Pseudomonadota bacterium]|nr:ribonuclease PH [Pseudomonadota bacterium]